MEFDYYNYCGTKGYGHSDIYSYKNYLDYNNLKPEWIIVSVVDAITLTIKPKPGYAIMLYNKEEEDYCWIHSDFIEKNELIK